MYSVQSIVYSVQCTVHSVQCTVYSLEYSVQCTVHSVQCTVYLYRGWFDYLPSPTSVGQFAGANCSHRRGELWGHFIGPHLILVSPGSELSTKETSYWTSIRVSPRSQLSALSAQLSALEIPYWTSILVSPGSHSI